MPFSEDEGCELAAALDACVPGFGGLQVALSVPESSYLALRRGGSVSFIRVATGQDDGTWLYGSSRKWVPAVWRPAVKPMGLPNAG